MGRSEAVGLVLARPARLLGVEPFFMEFIAGIEETLAERSLSVLLHVVATHEEEIATHRRWAERDLVEAVIVVNLTVGDRRPDVLAGLGLPAIMVGAWDGGPDVPAVVTDSTGPVREALARLLELGHRRIARVTGPSDLVHTRARTAALTDGCRAAGIEPVIVEGDYSAESGAELTEKLLRRAERPTAIIYDNDVMAVAGLGAAKAAGVRVPEQLSLLAWDDSTMCRLASPALSTMSVDVHQFGVSVAESVLELIDGRPVTPRWSPAPRFVPRGTTAPVTG
ncbi:LacI family transcriptional regulator [Streptomyces sp. 3MP-14]|uniref:LacI family transcriptional regulator n=1 Tax=Streptomyces mimosae TaxID=2586635 RepID=A0A5N6A1E3_9ACTN|nr:MULTISPECIES: substrate-binding domain-containing protein [Streptomyces]KAB8161158.1 LacI family transcriptional regulator [Streptomyces mimosae]KAB8178969.1 LacI family transcriptional regulator [Streptomyces sp. 3MP-14]